VLITSFITLLHHSHDTWYVDCKPWLTMVKAGMLPLHCRHVTLCVPIMVAYVSSRSGEVT